MAMIRRETMRPSHMRNAMKLLFCASTLLAIGTVTMLTLWRTDTHLHANVQYLLNRARGVREDTAGDDLFADFALSANAAGRWRHLSDAQIAALSPLGSVLYLDAPRPPQVNRTFTILLWKHGRTTHERHMKHFTDKEIDPFATCAVKNCRVTYESSELAGADIVLVHLHRTTGVDDLPPTRRPDQLWAFATDECPLNTFLNGRHNLPDYNGLFNWSMHYRMDADIPVPYGRTVIKHHVSDDFHDFNVYTWIMTKKPDVTVAIMGSNCGSANHRWEYVRELQKWIPVDVYGGCGSIKCPGHFAADCPEISRYVFYLAFENANCDEYVTEKLWWNAYAKRAIPVVMGGGPRRRNLRQLLPPHSYISVEDFAAPRDLAAYLRYLVNTPAELGKYMQWRKYFDVRNEHGYFGTTSYHYCRVCEALNYNERGAPRIYNDLQDYWSAERQCAPAWDVLATS